MRLERIAAGPERDQFLPLFLLADESEMQVRSYYQRGDLFVLRGGDGVVRGVTLAIAQTAEAVELKAIAVPLSMHRQGFGRRMLGLVLAELRPCGMRRVIVGTGNAELGHWRSIRSSDFGSGASSATSSPRSAVMRRASTRAESRCATWCGWIWSCNDAPNAHL